MNPANKMGLLVVRVSSTVWTGLAAWLVMSCATANAADFPVPSPPRSHVDDRAGKVSAGTEAQLNQRLEAFERESSTQIVLSVFQQLPDDVTLEEFTVATAEAWSVGQEGQDNGVVLFLFVDDRKMRIEVGYGLEGAITDATASDIIRNVLRPELRAGDYDGALKGAATALMEAAGGEYVARASPERRRGSWVRAIGPIMVILWLFVLVGGILRRFLGGAVYGDTGRRDYSGGGWTTWSGGSGGGGSFGGGGGFSGGGGSFGGGGASGGW